MDWQYLTTEAFPVLCQSIFNPRQSPLSITPHTAYFAPTVNTQVKMKVTVAVLSLLATLAAASPTPRSVTEAAAPVEARSCRNANGLPYNSRCQTGWECCSGACLNYVRASSSHMTKHLLRAR